MLKITKLKLLLSLVLIIVLVIVIAKYFVNSSYVSQRTMGCGGDFSYDVKCPIGTYCKSLNQGPLHGGICTPFGR